MKTCQIGFTRAIWRPGGRRKIVLASACDLSGTRRMLERVSMKQREKPDRARDAARVEIARVFKESLHLERLPEYRTGERLMEHAIGKIVRLTEAENEHVALSASQWLVGYAGTLITKVESANTGGVIEELRALYRKALPERSEPLVEAEPEPEGHPERVKRS